MLSFGRMEDSMAPFRRLIARNMASRNIGGRCLGALAVTAALMTIAIPVAHAQGRRLIYVQNACSRPLRILLVHTDSARGPKQQGWYYFTPGEAAYLRSQAGDKLNQIEGEQLYAYAETIDSAEKLRWQANGPEVRQDGGAYRTMPMSVRIDKDGDLLTRFTCD